MRRDRPDLLRFLEVGVDLERGVDAAARAWVRAGAPTTYHFLDLNLEESEDLDPEWIAAACDVAGELGAAWLCGDAGLWHVGPRDRGHGVLLPPVLTAESAHALARNVRRLREASGLEVLPENPPAHAYAGDLHLLDYFARVADAADAGLLLDVAHLAIYQRATGHAPLDGLDGFPLDRVVEVHVAGGTEFEHGGRRFVDDDHAPEPLADTWQILAAVLPRASNLRAVVYECERNSRAQVLANFERLRAELDGARHSPAARDAGTETSRSASAAEWPVEIGDGRRVRRVQRAIVRMQHDAGFAERVAHGDPEALDSAEVDATGAAWLRALDPVAVAADRDGKRAAQLLRNVGSEFRLSAALGPAGDGDAWIRAFPRSPFFHAAIGHDGACRSPSPRSPRRAPRRVQRCTSRRCCPRGGDGARAARRRVAIRGASAGRAVSVGRGAPSRGSRRDLRGRRPLGERLDRGALLGVLPDCLHAARESILIVADLAADARFGRLPRCASSRCTNSSRRS